MERLFKTNFWGCVYGSSIAVEHLKKRGGALINVGSFFSDRATPVQSIYSASKHAMKGYTDALRMELEKEGAPISVSLVKPARIDTPYAEHARSYQEKQPSHRGIVYPPEIAAEGILYCAEHPKRDMYIGGQAKLAKIMGDVAPRLTDKVMEWTQFRAHRSDRPSRGPDDNGLHHPGYSLQENGNHLGWMRATSLYTKASMHPQLMAFAGLGALVLSTALLRRR
jgi:short-subunit dehydrogenase